MPQATLQPDRHKEARKNLEQTSEFESPADREKEHVMTLNMGPQHPSTHGVLRIIMRLDGEVVVDLEPVLGYLHRCHEKIYEALSYVQAVPFSDRTDYLGAIADEQLVVEAVEKAMQLEVPERAQYLRVLMNELQRIISHQLWWGTAGLDLGAFTPFLYAWRDREQALDLFDELTGARLLYHYLRIGGVRNDIPDGWFEKLEHYLTNLEKEGIPQYMDLLLNNKIFRLRTVGVGVISRETALAYGASGPVARASGLEFDVRKTFPYSIYDRFEFDVPTGKNGDVFDRALVRIEEMKQSLRIIRQVLRDIPEGKVMGKVPRAIRPPKGSFYHQVEGPRGEYACHIISDGSTSPYRFRWRTADFVNLQLLRPMSLGGKVSDAVACINSIDPVMGSVDK